MPEGHNTPLAALPSTSSTPLELPVAQESLFHEVLALLEKLEIPFAVSGAFALQQHTGICRFTKDLDVDRPRRLHWPACWTTASNVKFAIPSGSPKRIATVSLWI